MLTSMGWALNGESRQTCIAEVSGDANRAASRGQNLLFLLWEQFSHSAVLSHLLTNSPLPEMPVPQQTKSINAPLVSLFSGNSLVA